MDAEGAIGEVQRTEEERLARAIKGEGEFLSEEMKKFLKEIEVAHGLQDGALEEEVEARLRGVTEPSVEKLKEALREEMRILGERFLARNPRSEEDEIGRGPTDGTLVEPGGGPWGDRVSRRSPGWGQARGPGRHLCARSGQHTEDCAGTRVERAPIPGERSRAAVQVRG
jgi:hypothetical protein